MLLPVSRRAGRREWMGLGAIALPCLVYAMDLTVLNLAVPRLSSDLRPSSSQLLWIVDVYGFLVAGLLVTMGTLGDRIGRRRLLLVGAATFAIASALAASAHSAEQLIAARALLGVAGATLAPSTLSLIRTMFEDPDQRTAAVGIWIASFSVGGAVGPLFGGVLLEWLWWGSVFLLAIPVMALLLLLGPFLLPEYRDPSSGRPDWISAVLSLAAVLLVIWGLKQLAQNGAGWQPVVAVFAGLSTAVIFVRRQQTLTDPLLDLRLFRNRAFAVALSTNVVSFFVGFGALLFIAQYLQLVVGLSPLQAGLWMLPSSAGFVLGSLLTPLIARRARPAVVIAGGLALAALGFALLSRLDGTGGLAQLVTGSVVFSLGLAPVDTLAADLAVGVAPAERAGAAAALSETSAEFGGALGIALLGVIGIAVYRTQIGRALPSAVPAQAMAAARDTLGGAVTAAGQLPIPLGSVVAEAARESFTQGLQVAFGLCTVVTISGAIVAAIALRRIEKGGQTEEVAPGMALEPIPAARRPTAD